VFAADSRDQPLSDDTIGYQSYTTPLLINAAAVSVYAEVLPAPLDEVKRYSIAE
jgi:hypothetical protein